jgi:serine phosphatase RsbU (regulator of sigma subunit)/anti-sigma regulatory factor (Ser/Thr protein kinase)/putative methionine-R-sulfoxide reductase with GAF domain
MASMASRSLERVSRLQRMTAMLAGAEDLAEVAEVITDDIRQMVGAGAATLTIAGPDELRVVGWRGFDEQTMTRWATFPIDADLPLAEAVRDRTTVWMVDRQVIDTRWPGLTPDFETTALAVLPLVVGETSVGAIGLSFAEPPAMDDDERAFLAATAAQCAQAVVRARLHDAERVAREDAAAATRRISFLAHAAGLLSASLDLEETLRRTVDLAVPGLADWCAVYLIDERGDVRLFRRRGPEGTDDERVRAPVRAVAEHGETVFVADTDSEPGYRSAVLAPMQVSGRTVGVLGLATSGDRQLTELDRDMAEGLASRSAQAIVNAQLVDQLRQVARTLQASLLPPTTPSIPDLEVASRFSAHGDGIEVGGDFYDVVPLGRPSQTHARWAVIVGDVRGKGAEAAAITGAARHALRTSALRLDTPSAMLQELNEMLLVLGPASDGNEPRFCTAVVAVVDPVAPSPLITIAVGGHPPPMVLRADGRVARLEGHGPMLGVFDDVAFPETELVLHEGDALVLYTDGVTERHSGRRFFDEDGLAGVLAQCAGMDVDGIAQTIDEEARGFVSAPPRDDLAIVVVRVPHATPRSHLSSPLPVDTSAPGRARRFVIDALEAAGADDVVEIAALLTSEVVTNAVIHGRGPVVINLELEPVLDGHRIRVTVTDSNPTPPQRLELGLEATSGRGVHLLDELAQEWGVERRETGKSVWFELFP